VLCGGRRSYSGTEFGFNDEDEEIDIVPGFAEEELERMGRLD
jgi:hypothetical protein